MMEDLIAVFENKPPPTKVSPPFIIAPSLPAAATFKAWIDYVGPTLRHLMIRNGDSVVVYGSVEDSQVLIGYNTRTKMGGRFPANVVGLADKQPVLNYDLVVCVKRTGGKHSAEEIICDMGDYIRCCRSENVSYSYGLNQRTLEWGIFLVSDTKKIKW